MSRRFPSSIRLLITATLSLVLIVGTGLAFTNVSASVLPGITAGIGSAISWWSSPPVAGPSVTTDKADYSVGETVYITGSGFGANDKITLQVDDIGSIFESLTSTSYASWTVNADGSGAFTATWVVPQEASNRRLRLTATGSPSGLTASVEFTDASIGLYNQCSNDDGDGYPGPPPGNADPGCQWTNGNLQKNNSTYFEGDATVQRLWLTAFTPGVTDQTVTFQYGTTKGGKHAYDFLTDWDHSENWILESDLCQDITGCVGTSETRVDIPDDPNVTNTIEDAINRMAIRGGTITNISAPQMVSGSYGADSETQITVTFSVANSGNMCNASGCDVAFFFGAHIAETDKWFAFNGTTGATSIPGSPYHVALAAFNGASIGQRDNQMQAGAIRTPLGTITIIKDAVPDSAQDFNFTSPTLTPTSFILDDDADATRSNTQVFTDVAPGQYVIGETLPVAGWALTSIVCVDPNGGTTVNVPGGTTTVDMVDGEAIVCTFTNTQDSASITIVKNANPDNAQNFGFTTTGTGPASYTGGFTLDDDGLAGGDAACTGGNCLSQQTFTFTGTAATGSKVVTEGTAAGWVLTSVTCTPEGTGSTLNRTATVDLNPGDNVTCTFLNTNQGLIDGRIIVQKVTNPTSSTQSFEFDPSYNSSVNFFLQNGQSNDSGLIPAGTYSVSEIVPSGWDLTSTVCTSSLGGTEDNTAIALTGGETVTCVFTNSLLPRLRLLKATVPTNDNGKFDLRDGGVVKADEVGNGGDSGFFVTTIGSHTVSEVIGSTSPSALADYVSKVECNSGKGSADPGTSHTFSLAYGDEVTCTFTNSRLPRLKLDKATVPTTDPGKFDLRDGGVVKADEVGNGGTSGFFNTTIGSHTVSEVIGSTSTTTLADYASKVVCDSSKGSADPGTSHTFSLAYGDVVTCTFTNSRLPRLRLQKVTAPTTDPGKFDLKDGATVKADEVGNGGDSGFFVTTIGSHTVSEVIGSTSTTTLADYASKVVCDSSKGSADPGTSHTFSLAYGDEVTCVFTNSRLPKLRLKKVTAPTTDPGKFDLKDGATVKADEVGNGGDSGFFVTTIGSHTVSEVIGSTSTTTLADYASKVVCDSSKGSADPGTSHTFSLAYGDEVTCTFTNSRLPRLRLMKATVPTNDVGKFDLRDGTTVKADEVGNGGDSGFFNTTTGSHTVNEVAGSTSTTTLADYASKVECNSSKGSADPGTSHTFSLDYGEEVTCVFTNSRLPRLKLVKATVPASDPGKFDLRDGGVVKADEVGNGGTSGFYNTTTGSHTVSEVIGSTSTTALTDYVSKVECDSGKGSVDPGTSLAISLSYGDAVTCTFTNQRKPRLTIVKMTKGDPASFDFLIDRTGTSPVDPVDLTLDVVDPDGSASDGPHNIEVGDHNVQEVNIPDNWILTGAECTNAADVVISGGTLPNVTFTAGYGDDITCTFVNNQLGGTTRTQGFWSTHTYLANAVWNGWELPEGTSGQLDGWQPVIGSEDQFLCKADPVLYPPSGIAITAIAQPGQNQLMGGFWSNIANMSGSGKYKGSKRSALDKARMQFLQQYLAAVLNVHLFGTPLPAGYSLEGARTAYCTATADNMADLLTYRGVLAGYNEDGDLGVFTPGANATAQESRLQANIPFWDNTYR